MKHLWYHDIRVEIALEPQWTTGHKLAWNMPRACRTYLVQNMLAPHVTSLRADLMHRSMSFFHGLRVSPSKEASVAALLAAQDQRSGIGANLNLVRADRAEVLEVDSWRLPALHKLLEARLKAHYLADEPEHSRLTCLIDSITVN